MPQRILFALLLISGCGGASPPAPTHAALPVSGVLNPTEPAAPAAASVDPAPPAAAISGLHALALDTEDCSSPSSPVAHALLGSSAVSFLDTDDASTHWVGAIECALYVDDTATTRGVEWIDVNGDGVDEALANVWMQRSESGGSGARVASLVVLRASGNQVEADVLVQQDSPLTPEVGFENVSSIRVDGGVLYLTGLNNCYDCGCDQVEAEFSCASGPCRLAAARVVEAVEDCESP